METLFIDLYTQLTSAAFWSSLLAIVMIDLVLGGDNALVIGLAARNVPPEQQRRVILWGTAGAVLIRIVLTMGVVWILRIPGFQLAGGLALVWIGFKLVLDGDGAEEVSITPTADMRKAIRTIIIADAAMSIDNVLGVGGAAHGSLLLVGLGLMISIPIVVWGSTLVLRLVHRFPVVMLLGALVLAWTGAHMVILEPLLAGFVARDGARAGIYVLALLIVLAPELWAKYRAARIRKSLAARDET